MSEDDKKLSLKAIKTRLDGSAYHVGRDTVTWTDLKTKLSERFQPVQSVEEVDAKVQNLKFLRHIESIEDYLLRIGRLGDKYKKILVISQKMAAESWQTTK